MTDKRKAEIAYQAIKMLLDDDHINRMFRANVLCCMTLDELKSCDSNPDPDYFNIQRYLITDELIG